jgi:CRISPR-associated protein Cmr1
VVTPLFLGGADPRSTVELRAPSIKGALRFWWRALAWDQPQHGRDLEEIRTNEKLIFGSAASDDSTAGGQSSFGLRARWLERPDRVDGERVRSLTSGRAGASYLGYGVVNRGRGNPPRPCFQLGGRFELALNPLKSNAVILAGRPSLLDVVKLFGLLGGLGGRARRGWGSVALIGIDGDDEWSEPENLTDYRDRLRSILVDTAAAPQAPYSAFDQGTRLLIFGAGQDPLTTLDHLGQVYQEFRRVNRTHIFGLPHARFRAAERRASPLFFHLHPLKGQYAVAAVFLRAPFLAGDSQQERYRIIDRFFDFLPAALAARGIKQSIPVLSDQAGSST